MTTQAYFLSILLKRADIKSKKLLFNYGLYYDELFLTTNALKNSKIWDEFSNNGQELLAARVNGKVFLPDRNLLPSICFKDDRFQFKLSQFGKDFVDLNDSTENLIEIELFPRGDQEQLKDLIIDVEDLPENIKNNVSVDLKLEVDKEEKEIHSINVPLSEWKSRILEKYNGENIDYIVTGNSEGENVNKDEIIRKVVIDINDSPYIMIDKESKDIIKTKTFMKFKVKPLSTLSQDPFELENYDIMQNSFNHELTPVGKKALSRLRKNLSITYSSWMANYVIYAAPLVAFCQSSGSGKSKLSIESLKLNPGFYFVFRESKQTGYPRMNGISEELGQIIKNYKDKSSSQANLVYSNSTVGKVLDFFARIFVSYIRNISVLVKEQESLGSLDLGKNLEMSIHKLGSLFLDNELVEEKFPIIGREEIEKLYIRYGNNLTVDTVAGFFDSALINPAICFEDSNSNIDICLLLREKHFSKFPFLLILDEADILSNFKTTQKDLNREVSGFEILRRALGYINQGTASLFLTLGTKSDVVDLNPPMIDFSARLLNRKSKLDPITLTSNSNIFSKDYPISDLSPSYALLRNPFLFKFICTLGHSLWSAYPFGEIVPIALKKLKNGSVATKGYFLPVWMIRTGLAANPLHIKANSLVAGHMATLHDVQDEIKNFIVSYPSEPVLAIASRVAMKVNEDGKPFEEDVKMFEVLKGNTEAVALDVGRFAEVFGAMIILKAIDKTPNCARDYSHHEHDNILDEIKKLTPIKFHSLWEKESQLLEVPSGEDLSQNLASGPSHSKYPRYLEHYSVHKVGDFLKTLLNSDNLEKFGIPRSILNGIINATHFVTLSRDNTGFQVNNYNIKPLDLPSADDRISNSSRNIIDAALLKIGLLRQCGFAMPTNYYGLDFILPVCLENDDLTFIGIQIKRSDANMADDIFKMRSRLHLVKCPNNCIAPKNCSRCLSDETLQNIHGNHLSLLLSLDDEDAVVGSKLPKFSDNIKFRSSIKNLEDRNLLSKALTGKIPEKLSGLSKKFDGSDSFLKPLVQKTVKVKNNVGLAISLWDDRHVKIPKNSKEVKIFSPEPLVHRQFTVMTRGWSVFSELFKNSENVFRIANDMISNDGLFRHVNQRSDPQLVRCIVYDTAPSYVQYSDELLAMRGKKESYLDILDDLELKNFGVNIEKSDDQEISSLSNKLSKNLVISPPESPKKENK